MLCFGLEFLRLTSSTADCTIPSCPKQQSSGIFCIKNYRLACSQHICICAFRHSVLCPVIFIAILLALEVSSRFLDRSSAKRSSEIEVHHAHKDLMNGPTSDLGPFRDDEAVIPSDKRQLRGNKSSNATHSSL